MLRVRLKGLFLTLLPIFLFSMLMMIGNLSYTDGFVGWESSDTEPFGILFCFSMILEFGMIGLFLWMVFERESVVMLRDGYDGYKGKLEKRKKQKEREKEENKMMRCNYCNIEHKVVDKGNHLKKCNINPNSPIAKLEAKRMKENDPNLMTTNRKSQLEEIAKRVFPNARYFKYKGEKMKLTTDIGGFEYSSCNSRSIESIDKEMVADATRGYNRRKNSKSKNISSVTKSYSGICVQDTGGLFSFSECGNSTNYRCPRCRRYACVSCLGSRTYNGRKVCDGCNRSMRGD